MKNKFLILTFLTTTSLATNAWADVNCYDYCGGSTNATCPENNEYGCQNGGPSNQRVYYKIETDATDSTQKHLTVYGPETAGNDLKWTPSNAFSTYYESTIPDVTSVSISGHVGINAHNFNQATSLTSINFSGASQINSHAAWGCPNLTSVDFTGVTMLGNYALYDNPNLTSVVLPETFFNGDNLKSSIYSAAFSASGIHTFYCPENKTCPTDYFTGLSATPTIISYTKDAETGVYTVGDKMYASALDLTNRTCTGTGTNRTCVDSPIECTGGIKDCQIRALTYQGDKCTTQAECSNLIDMVSDSNYDCNSITTCSAFAKNPNNNINLASLYAASSGGTSGSQGAHGKRIYTVEEARQAVEAAGTDTVKFRIRYK